MRPSRTGAKEEVRGRECSGFSSQPFSPGTQKEQGRKRADQFGKLERGEHEKVIVSGTFGHGWSDCGFDAPDRDWCLYHSQGHPVSHSGIQGAGGGHCSQVAELCEAALRNELKFVKGLALERATIEAFRNWEATGGPMGPLIPRSWPATWLM